jgi:N-acetylmuramoyl-L-alanine amidase
MTTVDETKSRLLRGVVQDNIEVLQGVKSQRRRRRRFFAKHWWMAGFLLLGTAYLLRPAAVVSTARVPAPLASHGANAGDLDQTPETAGSLANPRPIDRGTIPLTVKRIVIDPGHGGEPGAISASGVTEKEITLDVALRLRRLLADAPFEVLLTRQTDRLIPLDKRVAFANENKADLFVSIHVNWLEPRTIRALETYYVGPSDDPATLKLASMENKDSGYSLSDYKKILEKIYVDARHDESKALAKTIQANLFRTLRPVNPVLENRGVKSAPFVVLIGTQMPAVLVEISCLSNDDEVKLLTKDDYRESIALALVQGIRGYAQSLAGAGRKGS